MNYAKEFIDNYRKYAVEKGFNIRILDVDAPLRAMNTLKMFVQKAINDFNGYSANCLASDKFCQKFIDMMDVMDGKELFADTIEEVLLNNYDTCEAGEGTIRLQPYQCLVLKVNK